MLQRLHRTTAAVVASFAAIHIANHIVAPGGVPMHLAFMKIARLGYRQPLLEPLLFAAVGGAVALLIVLALAGVVTAVDVLDQYLAPYSRATGGGMPH